VRRDGIIMRTRITVDQIKQNSYAKLYKFLFAEEFKNLGSDAILLYTILRDRHELSLSNGWHNSSGEVYLIYTRADMQEMLNCSDKPVKRAMKKLIDAHLVEEERQGLNMPNLIYIMDETRSNSRTRRMSDSRIGDNTIQDTENVRSIKTNPIQPNLKKTDIVNTDFSEISAVTIFLKRFKQHFGYDHRKITQTPYSDAIEYMDDEDIKQMFDEYFRKYGTGVRAKDIEKCSINNVFASAERYARNGEW